MGLREGKEPAEALQPKEHLSNKATCSAAPDPFSCVSQPRWGKEAGQEGAGRR